MAYFSGLGVDRVEGGNTYLKGKVKGRESGRAYCLYYGYDNNLPNSSLHYTYFKGGTSDINLKDKGCYIPSDALASYEITCYMVGINCEDQQHEEDSEYVTVSEAAPTEGTLKVRAYDTDTGVFLFNASVYIDGIYYGQTLGAASLISTVAPGFHTITLSKDGYNTKVINTYVSAGVTVSEDGGMDPDAQIGHVNVTTVDAWTDTPITGAKIYVGGSDTGKTTPCTIDVAPRAILGHQFIATKDHFADAAPIRVITAGENNLEIRMQALGMQCDISIGSIEAPDVFPPPPLPTGLPSLLFGFKIPFTAGEFTYYGIGWVTSIVHTPSAVDVTNAFAKSLVVKVNGVTVSPTPVKGTGDISFDLLSILQGMNLSSVTDLKIEITHATRIWFDTSGYENTTILETTTETITIPVTLGFCSFAPVMSGPAEIPITIPFLPTLPPAIGSSVLDINLGASCKNLAPPSAVPIKIFLFGSDTPAIDMSVSPTSYTPDLSSYILSAITAMISAGTPIPDRMSVLLNCPEGYSADGFATTMTGADISIPLPGTTPPAPLVCIPFISNLSLPELQLTMTAGGVPGIPPTDPVTFAASMDCTQGGAAVNPTFPFTAVAKLHGDSNLASGSGDVITSTINVGDGSNEITDLAMDLILLLSTGKIDPTTQSLYYEIKYPIKIVDGVPSAETKTVSGIIGVSVPAPPGPGDIFCNITADLTAPDTIPLGATLMLPPGTTDLMVDLDLSAFCGDEAPTNPFSGLYATVYVNGTSLSYLYPDSGGKCSLNLATYWSTIMSTIASGARTIELEIQYPERVKYSTPSVQDWGTETKTINLDIPEPPVCVLTAADYFTCPDGAVIQLNECVNGVKMPTGATCPPPDVTPECVLTAADYFTCPDGTVIPLYECDADGNKVSTGRTCPPVDIREKTVYVTTPMVTRAGTRVSIVAFVRCGTEKSSGEEATVTANGVIITTTHTRSGKVDVSWIPVDAGLYTICVDVPASSLCGEGASSCTYLRVVSELSPPEIAAAEEEFNTAKDRIGEMMERI